MKKIIDLNITVYEMAKKYPELIDEMYDLGFKEIKKAGIISSLGRMMTIKKGAKMKNISLEEITERFEALGFEVTSETEETPANDREDSLSKEDERIELLKSYLRRLGENEALESVRDDFVKAFSEVEASEIMQAEQQLIKEGTPITEVQKLCDLHSALFHGATSEERIAKAEEAVEASIRAKKIVEEKRRKAKELMEMKGHPLNLMARENYVLDKILSEKEIDKLTLEEMEITLNKIKDLSIHYAKKGDLIYPHLKVKYEITGPSDVMWTVDDEIRDELSSLFKSRNKDEKWLERAKALLTRAKEMIYKEEKILFPICALNFTEDEWKQIYKDSKDYDKCFDLEDMIWELGEEEINNEAKKTGEKIYLNGGEFTVEELTSMLNTIPLEITFVDADDINRFFNEGPKLFKRPSIALGRDVYSCHPPKVETMVRTIINDFKNGKRDTVTVWMEKAGRTMLVKYMAVKNNDGKYLGTLEVVQDMEFAKEHFLKNE